MAIVRRLEPRTIHSASRHTETECTYSIVRDSSGAAYLQIDTYGSSERKITGKQSQSIRFSKEAVLQLNEIVRQFL